MFKPEQAGSRLIGAVRASACADAEAPFARLADSLRARGLNLAGVKQTNRKREGACRCDMILEDLSSGEVICISEDRGPEARGCRLDRGALAEASERVLRAIRCGADLVIVNKFGKAESEGGGMRGVIAQAVEEGIPVLVCANAEHHVNLMDFAGDLAVTLPLSEAAIGDWLDDVLSAAPARRCVEA